MMYYHYIMIPVQMLTDDDQTVRTQITLTARLKQLIEESAANQGQSLSEYLRRAALLRLYVDQNEKGKLKRLSGSVIGSVDIRKHPEWNTERKVIAWVKQIRGEW